ncbi:Serine/threonine-protein kinase PknB [Symmachiella macrocystis]|uniref:Serine/threonine-protein kinase PknB n=1 Tax=Symmachiella macrocystis TaxID=2527985 RepID=A0A5C6BQQ7_9PLAN|nr:protein kinase [Symmachiella macrocystis]TWU14355.1 Serine/threonine-protein kinase PknB [Symmachiella macrocystis]
MEDPLADSESALAQQIFLKAVDEIPADQWDQFVREACGENASLQSRVEELLAAHKIVSGYFDKPPTILASLGKSQSMGNLTGTVVDGYQLAEQIGQGGMGVVYIAHQFQPVRRQVAFKVVKPGMDTKQVIARFEIERRALAMMDHPNIAHVIDAGETESGRPYFVMELVRGKPITDFCDDAKLRARDRLRLFIKVCYAVQHAHQKGIIHRDIKPSNVMVTHHDRTPVPKIIDFGVAKAINQESSEETAHTLFAQLVGTPLYMSPEQAEWGGADVDTRTDIYALGVLLYELLTGTTPFDRQALYEVTQDEMRRIIREDEPLRPSSRINTLDKATLTDVMECRRTDRKRLGQTLSGDLDWIIVRAIEKDPQRRYQTAGEFADDLQRFLNDEPVAARPPSASYRLRKFARRHRAALGSAAAIALSLILGITVSTWQALEMHHAWKVADERSETADWQRERAEHANSRIRRLLYVSEMKVAADALRREDIPSAVQLLNHHLPIHGMEDLRGFEWHYMNRLVELPSHATMSCPDGIFCVQPSPDGSLLAAACGDGNIYIFDVQTGKAVRTISTGAESANYVCWTSDQTEVATADANGRIQTWNVSDGMQVQSTDAHDGEVYCLHYLPGDATLVSSGSDEMIYSWDRATGKKIGEFAGHERDAEQLAVSPDGRYVASASSDGTLRLWDLQNQEEPPIIWDFHDSRVLCVAYSQDGRHIAAGTVHGGVFLVDTKTNTHRKLGSQPDGVESVTFLSDGDWLATGDRGATIHLWPVTADAGQDNSMSEKKIMPYWKAHTGRVQALAVTPGSNLLVSGGLDGVINMWTTNPQSAEWQIATPGLRVMGMALGNSNQLYIAGNEIIRYNLARREGTSAFSTPQPRWMSLATSNDGRRMAATDHKTLSMFDLDSQQLIQSWPISPELDDPQMAVSPDGQKVATAWWSSVDYIEIYDVDRPDQILSFPAKQSHAIDFSPDGDRLAYGTMNDLVVRDIVHDKELLRLSKHSSTLSDCAFDPSGDLIATVSHDRTLKLWNAHNGEQLYSVIAHGDKVKTVAFSPDGNTIVTGGRDQVVKLWDCQTGQPLFDFGTEADGIAEVQFSPDGQRLVCLLGNGTIVIYDISRPADNDT